MERMPLCTHCGFTWGEYRARGLLGCPHCYAAFGEALQGDLMWIHHALGAAAPEEAMPAAAGAAAAPSPEQVAQWREQMADAVRREEYAEAARLQRLIRGEHGRLG